MELRSLAEAEPFTTKDGSTIRELHHTPVQSLAEATLGPGQATQRHYHARSEEIYLLTDGGGRLEIDGESREVGVGRCGVDPTRRVARARCRPRGRAAALHVRAAVLPRRYVLRMKRLASALVLVLALAALAAGCGGDDCSDGGDEAVEPATWASGFCDALQTFTTGISDAGSELAGEGIPSSDEIIEVIDNAATAASTFADDLRELGRPDVPSGEEIQNELETAASEAR